MMKYIALPLLALSLCGCNRVSLDPDCAFRQVQGNVFDRSGQTITWNREECQGRVSDLLKDDLTVDRAVQVAILNNSRLQAVYENLGIGQASLVQAGLLTNPIFNFSQRNKEFTGSANILEMSLMQNFLDILLRPQKMKLARTELQMIKDEIAAQVMDIIAETKTAYYSLQANEQILFMKKQMLEAAEDGFDVANRLHDAGNITNLFLITHRSEYEQTKMDVISLEVDVMETKEKLNVLMGVCNGPEYWKISSDRTPIPEQKIELNDLENYVIENSLELKIAREKMCATALIYGIETVETIFPELSVGIDSEHEPKSKWFVGPQFSIAIPIFDFGQANKAMGRAELLKQWSDYTALAVEIRSAARFAGFRLQNAHYKSQYSQKVLVPLAKEITSETLLQLNAMQLGVFDLLLAKRNELETTIREVIIQRDYWIAQTEVEALLSGRGVKK